MKKPLLLVCALAATLGVLRGSAEAQSPYDWAADLPGCDPSRPAVAHHAGQQVLPQQPGNGPVPCGMLHGWPTVETRIEVTRNAVIQQPAFHGGVPFLAGGGVDRPGSSSRQTALVHTFDEGRTWNVFSVQTGPETLVLGSAGVDNNLYVDHDTDRLFAYFYGASPFGGPVVCGSGKNATIAFSDDSGTTWAWGYDIDHNCSENPTILAAKPTVSDASQMSYPNVVYLCGRTGITDTGVGGAGSVGFACSKSLDGGRSWRGQTLEGQGCYAGSCKDLSDPYPECDGASSSGNRDPQPLPDGSILVVVSCGDDTYLSESTDEGASWSIRHQIPSGGSLRADSAGNLYKLRGSLLSTSTDGGATWSDELEMIAPGVVSRGTTFFAQGTHRDGHEPGRAAMMYYGIREGNTTSDGFITETRNALDPNPVFWSGQVNQPDRPLLYNTPGSNIGVTVLDFIGGAFSPDGRSVWAAFVQDCGTNMLTDPNCQARWPEVKPLTGQDGFAGRLVWRPQDDGD